MPDIKIDKNVPLPKRSGARKYPWASMQVGDSFFISLLSMPTRNSLYACAKWAGIKISVNSVTEDGVRGVRVWRIADEKPPQKIRAA